MTTAVNFRHNLQALWSDCKTRDGDFLPEYEVRESVLQHNLLDSKIYDALSADERDHLPR